MRSLFFRPVLFAVILSFIFPSSIPPAYGLRQAGLESSEEGRDELAKALQEDDPLSAVAQTVASRVSRFLAPPSTPPSPATGPSPAAAGMEESQQRAQQWGGGPGIRLKENGETQIFVYGPGVPGLVEILLIGAGGGKARLLFTSFDSENQLAPQRIGVLRKELLEKIASEAEGKGELDPNLRSRAWSSERKKLDLTKPEAQQLLASPPIRDFLVDNKEAVLQEPPEGGLVLAFSGDDYFILFDTSADDPKEWHPVAESSVQPFGKRVPFSFSARRGVRIDRGSVYRARTAGPQGAGMEEVSWDWTEVRRLVGVAEARMNDLPSKSKPQALRLIAGLQQDLSAQRPNVRLIRQSFRNAMHDLRNVAGIEPSKQIHPLEEALRLLDSGHYLEGRNVLPREAALLILDLVQQGRVGSVRRGETVLAGDTLTIERIEQEAGQVNREFGYLKVNVDLAEGLADLVQPVPIEQLERRSGPQSGMEEAPIRPDQLRLLVADDDPGIPKMVLAQLEPVLGEFGIERGEQLSIAETPQGVLKWADEKRGQPLVVLTDWNFTPGGAEGKKIVQVVLVADPRARIVVISGAQSAQQEADLEALAEAPSGPQVIWLGKPFTMAQLQAAVRLQIRERLAPPAGPSPETGAGMEQVEERSKAGQPLTVTIYRTPEEIGQAQADEVMDLWNHAIRQDKPFVVGLPTGSTPMPLLRELVARLGPKGSSDRRSFMEKLYVVAMDDIVDRTTRLNVQPTHEKSAQRFFEDHLIRPMLGEEPTWVARHLIIPRPGAVASSANHVRNLGGIRWQMMATDPNEGHVAEVAAGERYRDPAVQAAKDFPREFSPLFLQHNPWAKGYLGITFTLDDFVDMMAPEGVVRFAAFGQPKADIISRFFIDREYNPERPITFLWLPETITRTQVQLDEPAAIYHSTPGGAAGMEDDSWRKLLTVPAVVASAALGAETQAPELLEEQVVAEAKVSFDQRKITVSGLPEELLRDRAAALVAIENDKKREPRVWYFQPKDPDGAWHFPVEKGVVTVTTDTTDQNRLYRPEHVWIILLKDGKAETALRERIKKLPLHKGDEADTYLVQSVGRPDLSTLLKDEKFVQSTGLAAFRVTGDEKKPTLVRLVPRKAGMEEQDLERELLYPSTSERPRDLTFAEIRRRYWTHPRRLEMEPIVIPFLAGYFGQSKDWVRGRLAKGSVIAVGGNPFASLTDALALIRAVQAYREINLKGDSPLGEVDLNTLVPSIVSTIDRNESPRGPFAQAVREILVGFDARASEAQLAKQIWDKYGPAAGSALPPAGPSVPPPAEPPATDMEEKAFLEMASGQVVGALRSTGPVAAFSQIFPPLIQEASERGVSALVPQVLLSVFRSLETDRERRQLTGSLGRAMMQGLHELSEDFEPDPFPRSFPGRRTIWTVTTSPTIDIDARKKLVNWGERKGVLVDPGGGGINVVIALARRGVRARPVFFYAGETGKLLVQLVQNRGVLVHEGDAIEVKGDEQTRVTIGISMDKAGSLVPKGTPVNAEARLQLEGRLLDLESGVKTDDIVVMSGSLAPGLPEDFYADLGRKLIARGATVVVDTKGGPARAVLFAKPAATTIYSQNHFEFGELVGIDPMDRDALIARAKEILEAQPPEQAIREIIITMGAGGAVSVTREKVLNIRAPKVDPVSELGAGDTSLGERVFRDWQGKEHAASFIYGVAAGTASVLHPGTGGGLQAEVDHLAEALGLSEKTLIKDSSSPGSSDAGMEEDSELRVARAELSAAEVALAAARKAGASLDIIGPLSAKVISARGQLDALLQARPIPAVEHAVARALRDLAGLDHLVGIADEIFDLKARAVLVDASEDWRVSRLAQALALMVKKDRLVELDFRLVISRDLAEQVIRELAQVDADAAEKFLRPRIVAFDGGTETVAIARQTALDNLAQDAGFDSGAQLQAAGFVREYRALTPGLAAELRAFFQAGGVNFVTDEAFDRLAALLEAA